MADHPVHCTKGCGREWPRDPAFEVACPECGAGVGARCKRPSGHGAWGEGSVHAARDILADQQGCYGPCPLGICGLEVVEARRTAQLDLFDG